MPAIVVPYDALPRVVAAPIPWKIGEETEVPTLIAAENEGVPAFATKTVFAPPCAVTPIAPAPFPYNTPLAANVDTPVPPLGTVRSVVSVTAPVTVNPPPSVVSPVPNNERVGLLVTFPKEIAVVVDEPAVMVEPLIVVAAPTLPTVSPVCVAVPIFIATPVAVS